MAVSPCLPCLGLDCFQPDDLSAPIDSAIYSSLDYSFIVECPPGCICQTGLFPRTISILASTIPPVLVPINEGSGQIILRIQGCSALITRTLSTSSSQAEINAAAQSMQAEWAGQESLCIARATPGVNCNTGTSIQVCNDAETFACPLDGQVSTVAGTRCQSLNITGLSADQIVAATALLKSQLNFLARQTLCPLSGIICTTSVVFTPAGNIFTLNITNNSSINYDGTPFCVVIPTAGTFCGNQAAIPPGGTLTDISISPALPLATIRLTYFGVTVFTVTVPNPQTLTITLEVC